MFGCFDKGDWQSEFGAHNACYGDCGFGSGWTVAGSGRAGTAGTQAHVSNTDTEWSRSTVGPDGFCDLPGGICGAACADAFDVQSWFEGGVRDYRDSNWADFVDVQFGACAAMWQAVGGCGGYGDFGIGVGGINGNGRCTTACRRL